MFGSYARISDHYPGAYVYLADLWCKDCIVAEFTPEYIGEGEAPADPEALLYEVAERYGVDYDDPWGYDSDEFPKPVPAGALHDACVAEEFCSDVCGECFEVLGEVDECPALAGALRQGDE